MRRYSSTYVLKVMKTASRTDLKSKTFSITKIYTFPIDKEISFNIKLYQKLFVLFIAFSTILIFPESPRELGKICESYNSRQVCNVW